MSNLIKNKKLNSSGQALVEFAIILPLLFMLVFGITEFGRFLYLQNSATQAAREGARKAAVTNPWNETVVKDYVMANPSISIAEQDISISTTPPTSPTLPKSGDAVSIEVRKHFSSVVPNLIPIFKNLTSIRATATMRYE